MKCSIQILNRGANSVLAFDTQELLFWEIYSNEGELVLGFKGASEAVSLFKKDVDSQDFEDLVALLRKEFPDISMAKVLEQP